MTNEEGVQFVLDRLKAKTSNKSDYADAILEFFELDNRFHINALVYKKDMEPDLVPYILSQMEHT